jgi:multidrug transporter EmrE-like cation transporter
LCYKYFDFSVAYPILKLTAPLTAIMGMMLLNERNDWKIKVVAVMLAFLGAMFIKVL